MSATRSLPDANSQKNGIVRNCTGQRRSPTTAQKPRLQTIWLAKLFASLPQYPHLIHYFTTNCADSQTSAIAFLQSRISLWSYFFSKLKNRPARRITNLNNNIYTLKWTAPSIASVYSASKLFEPNIQLIIHNQPLVQAPNGPPKYHSMLYHIEISNIINQIIYTLGTNILRVETILSNHSKSTKILAQSVFSCYAF